MSSFLLTALLATPVFGLALHNISARDGSLYGQGDATQDFVNSCLSESDNNVYYPCQALMAMEFECGWGFNIESGDYEWPTTLPFSSDDVAGPNLAPLPAKQQRDCFCQSQFWSLIQACHACAYYHSVDLVDADLLYEVASPLPHATVIGQFESTYCAASSTPTGGFGPNLYSALDWTSESRTSSSGVVAATAPASTVPLDPSVYYTPSPNMPAPFPVFPTITCGAKSSASSSRFTTFPTSMPTLYMSGGLLLPLPSVASGGGTCSTSASAAGSSGAGSAAGHASSAAQTSSTTGQAAGSTTASNSASASATGQPKSGANINTPAFTAHFTIAGIIALAAAIIV